MTDLMIARFPGNSTIGALHVAASQSELQHVLQRFTFIAVPLEEYIIAALRKAQTCR